MLILEGTISPKALAFAAGGARLVAVREADIEVWSVPDGERLYKLGPFPNSSQSYFRPTARVNAATSVHGRFLFICGEHRFSRFSVEDGKPVGEPITRELVRQVLVSHSEDWVVAVDADVEAADYRRRLVGYRCGTDGALTAAWEERIFDEALDGFIGDGERFVTRLGSLIVARDVTTGAVVSECRGPAHAVCGAASLDGGRYVVGSNKLYLWDTAVGGQPFRITPDSKQSFVSLAFHPTQPILAAIQRWQMQVRLLDSGTGRLLNEYEWNLGEMTAVAFSPDGALAAAGSASGKIVVWDVDE